MTQILQTKLFGEPQPMTKKRVKKVKEESKVDLELAEAIQKLDKAYSDLYFLLELPIFFLTQEEAEDIIYVKRYGLEFWGYGDEKQAEIIGTENLSMKDRLKIHTIICDKIREVKARGKKRD